MAGILCNPRYIRPSQGTIVGPAQLCNQKTSHDIYFSGDGQFANPVNDPITLNNIPYRAKLRVFEERSGRLIRQQWSEEDGTWTIRYLNRNYNYLVVCYDGIYPALAYDHQTPDLMT